MPKLQSQSNNFSISLQNTSVWGGPVVVAFNRVPPQLNCIEDDPDLIVREFGQRFAKPLD
jgi:hypothetical protein